MTPKNIMINENNEIFLVDTENMFDDQSKKINSKQCESDNRNY